MNSAVTSPTSAPSARRRMPPATITSEFGLVARMFATLRLLVMTIRLRCFRSARATASVVVPMFMKIETPSGICCRHHAGDRVLLLARQAAAVLVAERDHPRGDHRAAVHAGELADVAELAQVAADGLRGDVEMRGQPLDRDLARLARDGQDLGVAEVLGHQVSCGSTAMPSCIRARPASRATSLRRQLAAAGQLRSCAEPRPCIRAAPPHTCSRTRKQLGGFPCTGTS